MPTMRSIRVHSYGGPDQLKLEVVPREVPQAGEVLVRVHAAAVNPVDWKIRQGWLKDFRPMPMPYTPGMDLAGVIEAVGPEVTAFEIGQEVFGQTFRGTYAEYAVVPVETLAKKPKSLPFAEAVTLITGATLAWQGLFEEGGLQTGQRVLILGAAGGVGLFAVQLARRAGAHVIGTTSTPNVDFVRGLGAEHIIDYTAGSGEPAVKEVDVLFDTVGGTALKEALPVLKRGGTLISIIGPVPQVSQEQVEERGIRAKTIFCEVSSERLATLARLLEERQIQAIVSKSFFLHEAHLAHEISQSGHGRGRIILQMAQ